MVSGNTRHVDLTRVDLCFRLNLDRRLFFQRLDWQANVDHVVDAIAIQANMVLLGREEMKPIDTECTEEGTVVYPTTWWDAVKHRWMPKWQWLWWRWPPDYTVKVITKTVNKTQHITRICPHIDIKYPDMPHIDFLYEGEEAHDGSRTGPSPC